MRTFFLLAILLTGCDDGSAATDAAQALSDGGVDPGCGAVDFCLEFIRGGTFSQCLLPYPPGTDGNVAIPYSSCVSSAASAGGACYGVCASPDAGAGDVAACVVCLHHQACVAQAAACGFAS